MFTQDGAPNIFVILKGMYHVLQQNKNHDQGFNCIWQVRFKLSRVAEAQFKND
jgi:hypothetical protein